MTLAAIAPFADCVTRIHNIGHIRFQESDRIHAILTELQRMGVRCEEVPEIDGIQIFPWKNATESGSEIECATEGERVTGSERITESGNITLETYDDHRMAMAFTLPGLKTGNIVIRIRDVVVRHLKITFP